MVLAAMTWGDPTAPKRVLLLHGIAWSSLIQHRLAQALASRGYFVTAPDMLGHGCARRSEVYTVAAFAEEILPLLAASRQRNDGDDRPYHIVIGHSLGGLVAVALLHVLASPSKQPVRVVLVDPPFEVTDGGIAEYRRTMIGTAKNIAGMTIEAIMKANPLWTEEDAMFAYMGARLCKVPTLEAISEQNIPWSFSHSLSTVPDNVQVTVLAADPSKWACVKEEDLKAYPHITVKTVRGTSHAIPLEAPEAILETALGGQNVVKDTHTATRTAPVTVMNAAKRRSGHLARL